MPGLKPFAIALALTVPPAQAQTPVTLTNPATLTNDASTRHDIQCLVSISPLMDDPDPNVRNPGLAGANYFMGKIINARPAIDLKSALIKEASTLDAATLDALPKECSTELVTQFNQMTSAIHAFEDSSQKQPPTQSGLPPTAHP